MLMTWRVCRYKAEASKLRKLSRASAAQRQALAAVQKAARALSRDTRDLKATVADNFKAAAAQVSRGS